MLTEKMSHKMRKQNELQLKSTTEEVQIVILLYNNIDLNNNCVHVTLWFNLT